MIEEKNLQKALNLIVKEKKPVIVKAQEDKFNRKVIETGKIDVLLDVDSVQETKLKDANSGFNHVLANIAKKKDVSIGISFDKLSSLEGKEKARALEKLRQNLKIIDKKKLKIAIFGSKNKVQTQSLLRSLGASSEISKRTQYF